MNSLPSRFWTMLFAIVMMILCLSSMTVLAQGDFYKHHPWPDIKQKSTASPAVHSPKPFQLCTTSTHLDTAAFSYYPADLTGVVVGNAQWFDYDNDGDLDIIVSGVDSSSVPVTKIYRNDNGIFTDIHADIPGIATERGLSWGDYDNDGDFDLAITGTIDSAATMPVSRIYRNDNGAFVDIHANLVPVLGGVATWVDYNLDGRLDLLIAGSPDIGSSFYTKLYRNDDSTFNDSGIYFPGVWGASVDWADYDNDGDPDLLLTGYGTWGVTSGLFRNDGTTFTYISLPFAPVNFSAVSWGDFDNDGKFDFIVSGDPIGWDNNTFTALYHCTGNGTFELIPTNLPQVNGCAVAWGDYDNDGDLDLAINGWHDDSTNITKIFRNDSNGVFTDIGVDLPGTWWGSVAWGDVDNDGRLDLLISGGTTPQPYSFFYIIGGSWYPMAPITAIYHNNTSPANEKPAAPPSVSTSVSGSQVTFSWQSSTDDRTPQSMLTYNLRVGSSPDAEDIVAPSSNLTSGYRRLPKVGNNNHKLSRTITLPVGKYYWSVQSVDNGYAGSTFASEGVLDLSNGPRWQLISLPYTYSDNHRSVLFPTAVSNAFGYEGSIGYVVHDVLENGAGYWLKFPSKTLPTPFSGTTLTSVNVPVTQGWNMIGSISQNLPMTQVTSQPPGIVTSQLYKYDGSYTSTNILEPGKGYWVRVNQNGTLVLSSSSNIDATARIRVVPTDELPPSSPDDQTKEQVQLPANYALEQNYPNPFNPTTQLQFAISKLQMVTLKIYDVLGREIATIVNEELQPGVYTRTWDATNISSGMYFYKMKAGTYSEFRKMLLVK